MLSMYNAAPAAGTTRMHKLMVNGAICEQVDVPDLWTNQAMQYGFAPETCDQVGYTKEEGHNDMVGPDGKTYEVSAWLKGAEPALPLQQLYGSSHSYLQNLYGSSHSYLQNLYGSSHSYLQNMVETTVVHGVHNGYCLQTNVPDILMNEALKVAVAGPCSADGYTKEDAESKTVQTRFGNYSASVWQRPTMLIWEYNY